MNVYKRAVSYSRKDQTANGMAVTRALVALDVYCLERDRLRARAIRHK
jgi:hypothetical protein